MTANENVIIESLKELLAKHGMNTLSALAKKLTITPSTLSRNLGNFAKTQNYDSKFAKKLAECLFMTAHELREYLTLRRGVGTTITDQFIRTKLDRLKAAQDPYHQEIMHIFEHLGERDRYTFVTSERPFEYEHPEFRDSIVRAVGRKVVFRYIFPNPDKKRFAGEFQLYYRHGELVHEWKELRSLHVRFLRTLKDKHPDIGVRTPLRKYLQCFPCSDPFLMNPLIKIMLIELDHLGDVERRAFVEHTSGHHDSYHTVRHWYPLAKPETRIVADAIQRATKE